MEKKTKMLLEQFNLCKSVPNTKSLHFIHPITCNSIEFSLNSPFSNPQNMHEVILFPKISSKNAPISLHLDSTSSENALEEGQWIAVLFDDLAK